MFGLDKKDAQLLLIVAVMVCTCAHHPEPLPDRLGNGAVQRGLS